MKRLDESRIEIIINLEKKKSYFNMFFYYTWNENKIHLDLTSSQNHDNGRIQMASFTDFVLVSA